MILNKNWFQFAVFVGAAILIVVAGLLGGVALQMRWLAIMVIMIIFCMILGYTRTTTFDVDGSIKERGRFDGIFIDGRKKMSLSYLQIILWTFIIFSAYASIVLHRTIPVLEGRQLTINWEIKNAVDIIAPKAKPEVKAKIAYLIESLLPEGTEKPAGEYDPLAVEIPPELWALLGISTASLVGAGLIKINKATTGNSASITTFEDAQTKADNAVKDIEKKLEEITDLENAKVTSQQAVVNFSNADAVHRACSQTVAGHEVKVFTAAAALDNLKKAVPPDTAAIVAKQEELEQLQQELANESKNEEGARAELSKYTKERDDAAAVVQKLETTLANKGIDPSKELPEDDLKAELVKAQEKKQALDQEKLQKEGSLQVNADIKDAKWSDIFSRELIGASQLTDIGKVQMFLLTIILVLTYSALLWAAMSNPYAKDALQILPTVTLPAITDSMLVLLGISHVGYLAVKGSG